MSEYLEYYVGFSHFLGIGPYRFSLLLHHYQSVTKAYKAPLVELIELIGDVTARKFDSFRQTFDPHKKMQELRGKDIDIIAQNDTHFPAPLCHIPDTPICIYIKGDIRKYDFTQGLYIGIVGTRRPTVYGQEISRIFSADLTQSGCIIVSGMAAGVDTAAHYGCVNNGGRTIAVLGCGVDIVYPPQNKKLYELIISRGGLVLSEFPPGMSVMPGLFVARNRLISGLSAGIVVIEGLKQSGSLITAKYASEQGKDVFVPPVPITSSLSEAPTILFKQGAKMVTSAEDILEEYGRKAVRVEHTDRLQGLNPEEKTVAELLMNEPLMIDDLIAALQRPLFEISNIITNLEINGVIEKNIEGKYQMRSI